MVPMASSTTSFNEEQKDDTIHWSPSFHNMCKNTLDQKGLDFRERSLKTCTFALYTKAKQL